ncbi:MAG: fatty acid oxidation complex subunit alpha FadB, partial [bacterium]
MLFQGQSVTCQTLDDGLAELKFDRQGESVNVLNQVTVEEFGQAVEALEREKGLKGLLISSGKPVFIVGADIKEFLPLFQRPEEELTGWLAAAQRITCRLEDLPFPSVALLDGYALGGGLEVALAATYRVASPKAVVGQPEVKLGLVPGFGGTVRLPRLIGVDNAIDLIASGREVKADEALKLHLVQAVVPSEKLAAAGRALLGQSLASGAWKEVVEAKRGPVLLNGIERIMAFTTAKAFVGQQAGPNYPAPVEAVALIEKSGHEGRDTALELEAQSFAKLAKTPAAVNLIGVFHADQFIKKLSKKQSKKARPVGRAAVVGAGIMGGGIAYQSASRGVPVVMKDVAGDALAQGLAEASRLLAGQLGRGRISQDRMAATLNAIQGTLSYGDFSSVELVVEAVVEKADVKKTVLAEVEAVVGPETVLASNTSTISIDSLATALSHPERFCGMHFFNPVHRMPLVEVIRGKASSEETIATVVAFAGKMGKTPIVVADCPGFLVNRLLSPYMAAFQMLVSEGAPIETIDKAMEKFGWPMGPAYLSDVVGIDTARHAGQVMDEGYGGRMTPPGTLPNELLYQAGAYGQKTEKGYYSYVKDRKGKPQKSFDPAVMEILKPAIVGGGEKISGEEIVERMMIPMVIEASRCLADGIVDTPTELDVSLIFGLGFPP